MTARRIRRALALLTAAAAVGLLGACAPNEPQAGEGFRFPLTAEPQALDPQTAGDEAARTVIDLLFEGLTAWEDGRAVPAAADWSVSSDGCVYLFTLREGAWSNGDAVTADDFLFAYERTMDPATASPHAAALKNIQTVEAPDAHTLRVTLKTADERFPALLATGVWYPCPRAFFETCAGGWGMEAKKSLQNGAFSLKAWNHGESLLLSKNASYRAADEIAPAAVRLVIGAEENAAALRTGQLDGCLLADGEDAAGLTVTEVSDTLGYLWFNTTVSPLNLPGVRRALRDAVEWETVNGALPGSAAVSYVSAAAGVNGLAYDSPLTPRVTDADAARAALSEALETAGLSGCPTLTLLCEEGEDALRLAQYIVQSWQKNLALYFTIEQLPADTLTARVKAGNYHLAILSATAPGDSPGDALGLFCGSAADGNWARYTDTAWNAQVAAAVTAADFAAAEQALAQACPAIPLYRVTRRFGLAADVVGVKIAPFTARIDFRHAKR